MCKFSLLFLLLFLSSPGLCPLHGQSLEEDNNLLFLKANILYETSRYDEAIRLYNRILNDDPAFSEALFMRAKAKYTLSAFRGTKTDLLEYIDRKGLNRELIIIMARTELKLENRDNALSYYEVLHRLSPYEGEYFTIAGDIADKKGNKNKACEYWIKGAKLGDAQAVLKAYQKCAYDHIHLPAKRINETTQTDEGITNIDNSSVTEETINEMEAKSEVIKSEEATKTEEEAYPETMEVTPVDLSARREIVIDDELTIIITYGLGDRKVEEYPNILMLSNKSGKVAIKICVGAEGKVLTAELDDKRTSIFRSSLSSLAIRKAKEFVFIPSLSDQQCGLLVYDIKTD